MWSSGSLYARRTSDKHIFWIIRINAIIICHLYSSSRLFYPLCNIRRQNIQKSGGCQTLHRVVLDRTSGKVGVPGIQSWPDIQIGLLWTKKYLKYQMKWERIWDVSLTWQRQSHRWCGWECPDSLCSCPEKRGAWCELKRGLWCESSRSSALSSISTC